MFIVLAMVGIAVSCVVGMMRAEAHLSRECSQLQRERAELLRLEGEVTPTRVVVTDDRLGRLGLPQTTRAPQPLVRSYAEVQAVLQGLPIGPIRKPEER